MTGTVLLLNHVQSSYLDSNNPEDVALRQKIYDFVEQARPYVDKVVWSYADSKTALGSFDIDIERPDVFREGDIEVQNNNGKGDEPQFLQTMFDIDPDQLILAGVYFEACSHGTATSIKQNFGSRVAVPMDLTNKADANSESYYREVALQMEAMGIDVRSTSDELLDKLKSGQDIAVVQQSEEPLYGLDL